MSPGRILRTWMPAIHAGMTEAAEGPSPRTSVLAERSTSFLSSVGERNLHESLRGKVPVQARLTSCEHLGYRSADDPHAQNQ